MVVKGLEGMKQHKSSWRGQIWDAFIQKMSWASMWKSPQIYAHILTTQ